MSRRPLGRQLATQSQWGWHSAPNPAGWTMDRYLHTPFDNGGRQGGYADIPGDRRTPEVAWLRATAMIAAGGDGAPDRHAPGFPADASWTVRWEGRLRLP